METIHERVRYLRKSLGMTQQAFGERVSVKPTTITQYEIGRTIPPDPVISLICREFNVNELWLRYGDGEMFVKKSPDEEIEAFMLSVLRGQSDSFKHRFAKVIATMTEDEWALLERKIKELQEP